MAALWKPYRINGTDGLISPEIQLSAFSRGVIRQISRCVDKREAGVLKQSNGDSPDFA